QIFAPQVAGANPYDLRWSPFNRQLVEEVGILCQITKTCSRAYVYNLLSVFRSPMSVACTLAGLTMARSVFGGLSSTRNRFTKQVRRYCAFHSDAGHTPGTPERLLVRVEGRQRAHRPPNLLRS